VTPENNEHVIFRPRGTGRDRVMKAFIAGKSKKASAMSTDGQRVYSYNMEIARRQRNGKVVYLLPPSQGGPRISDTTSMHIGSCAAHCRDIQDSRGVKKLPGVKNARG
jgi:hypothetical protein